MSFFNELKRRNVFKVAAAYLIVAWLLLQVSDTLVPALHLPDWFHSGIAFILILGFPVAIIFAWAFELTPAGLIRESEVDRTGSITHQTGRKLDFFIIGVLVVTLSYFIWESRFSQGQDLPDQIAATNVAEVADAGALTSVAPDKSIAVLPFINMSNDPDQEYFSDGISEELLNVLAQYPGLRVAARTSSFQFKGKNPDIADIAAKLNVNYVLEGSVRKSGNRLRITAQLIETETGFHLWSETYDREMTEVFAIQDEISAAIGAALKIQLALDGDSGQTSPTVQATASTAAFEAYMQGRQLINLRGRTNLEEAVMHLERALALDETYAPAHAQLAIAISLLSNTVGAYGDIPLEEVVARATPHIERAFELQPHLPEASAAATMLSLTAADYASVILNARRTLELNPSYADAFNWLYSAYLGTGQYLEAGKSLKRLLDIDPLSISGRFNTAGWLALGGQMEAARKIADSIAGQNQSFSLVSNARISYYAGHLADALGWSLKAWELNQDDFFIGIFMARILGQLGLLPEALRLQDEVHYWAYLNSQAWPELVAVARLRLGSKSSDPDNKLLLANALHLSGEIAQAQVFYEELLASSPGLPIIDSFRETVVPSARAAFGRLSLGNKDGALALRELTARDHQERNRAGIHHADFFRTAAILEAMQGNHPAALQSIGQAIETGPRDPGIFSEPAFEAFRDSPEFQSLESKLEAILAAEQEKALQIICFNNPAANTWQPLPETCEGVEVKP